MSDIYHAPRETLVLAAGLLNECLTYVDLGMLDQPGSLRCLHDATDWDHYYLQSV